MENEINADLLNKIGERFTYLQKTIYTEIVEKRDRELMLYKKAHKKPFFPFSYKGRKWSEGEQKIWKKYKHHPLQEELDLIHTWFISPPNTSVHGYYVDNSSPAGGCGIG